MGNVIGNEHRNVKVITNEEGDWCILEVDGEIVYEGHSIPNHVWLDLIADMDVHTSEEEISQEEMEECF